MSEEKITMDSSTVQKKIDCLEWVIEPKKHNYLEVEYEKDLSIGRNYEPLLSMGAYITFKLPPEIKPDDIRKLVFLNSTASKVSWGDTPYYGQNINDVIANEASFIDYASNSTLCNINNTAFINKEFKLMDIERRWGQAKLKAKQTVFFNWFYYEDNYYIQIGYKRIVEIYGSTSKGSIWLNLGTGLKIELYNS